MNCNTCGEDIVHHYYWCDKYCSIPCPKCGSDQHLYCQEMEAPYGNVKPNILIEDIKEGSNLLVGTDKYGRTIVRLRERCIKPFETKLSKYVCKTWKRKGNEYKKVEFGEEIKVIPDPNYHHGVVVPPVSQFIHSPDRRNVCTNCNAFNGWHNTRLCSKCRHLEKSCECPTCGQDLPKTFGCDNHKMILMSNIRGSTGTSRKKAYHCYSCKSTVRYGNFGHD